jgi:hypothetical protein
VDSANHPHRRLADRSDASTAAATSEPDLAPDQNTTGLSNARAALRTAAYVRHIVDGMPPLTEEQRAQLALIIRGTQVVEPNADAAALDVPRKRVA